MLSPFVLGLTALGYWITAIVSIERRWSVSRPRARGVFECCWSVSRLRARGVFYRQHRAALLVSFTSTGKGSLRAALLVRFASKGKRSLLSSASSGAAGQFHVQGQGESSIVSIERRCWSVSRLRARGVLSRKRTIIIALILGLASFQMASMVVTQAGTRLSETGESTTDGTQVLIDRAATYKASCVYLQSHNRHLLPYNQRIHQFVIL